MTLAGSTNARSATVSGAVFAVTLLATGVAIAIDATWAEALLGGAVILASAIVGLLLTVRRPGYPIGWLLSANGLLLALLALTGEYNSAAIGDGAPYPAVLAWTALWEESSWPLLLTGLTAVVFLFPDGRLPSPRWRPVALAGVTSVAGLVVSHVLSDAPFSAPYAPLEPPVAVLPATVDSVLSTVFIAGILAGLAGAAWAARTRLRRARGLERTQLLWLAYAALGLPLTVLVCLAGLLLGSDAVVSASLVITLVAIPVAVGIAVLRHGLLDIELVLNRTLVYGALTAAVVVVYAGTVVGLQALIGSGGLAGLVAVGVVAVGIQPLRLRLQKAVDRAVYGDRSDPYHALTRLGERLESTLAPAQVVEAIVESVAEALRLRYAAIEFDRAGTIEVAAAHGSPGPGATTHLPLTYQGETIAQLAIQMPPGRQVAPADRRLLEQLARTAGVAVHAVRLTADLQRSRERLVTAREEERRRLRRDLHDGLGPMLAGSVLQLDAARRRVVDDPRAAETLLDDLREQTQAAIADVRRLVDELRPPALDELGLVAALREQATRLGRASDAAVPWGSVEAPPRMPPLPAAVEVAAYRIVTEAMTNVARHAAARHCRVRLSLNGGLVLEVEDDGDGLPVAGLPGVGLRSMRERAAELGGSCSIQARPGGGTVVRARIPVDDA